MSVDAEVELESDDVVVGVPIRGRVHGQVPAGTHVRLRARELRGAEFWDQEEGRAELAADGSFELPGPMQPSFFGELFSIEWAVVVRTPLRDIERPVFVTAPIATRDVAVLFPPLEESYVVRNSLMTLVVAFVVSLPELASGNPAVLLTSLTIAGIFLGWRFGGFALRRTSFGPVVFDIVEQFPRYSISFGVRRNAFIRRVFIRLVCHEWIPNRGRRWIPRALRRLPEPTDTVVDHECDLADAGRVYVGDTKVFNGELTMPDDSPFTLHRLDGPALQWRAELWVETEKSRTKLSEMNLFVTAKRLLEAD